MAVVHSLRAVLHCAVCVLCVPGASASLIACMLSSPVGAAMVVWRCERCERCERRFGEVTWRDTVTA